jgi:hypothetical protein
VVAPEKIQRFSAAVGDRKICHGMRQGVNEQFKDKVILNFTRSDEVSDPLISVLLTSEYY